MKCEDCGRKVSRRRIRCADCGLLVCERCDRACHRPARDAAVEREALAKLPRRKRIISGKITVTVEVGGGYNDVARPSGPSPRRSTAACGARRSPGSGDRGRA